MSHTTGFRPKGDDPRQHHDEANRGHVSKASRDFEQHLAERHRDHDKHREEVTEELEEVEEETREF